MPHPMPKSARALALNTLLSVEKGQYGNLAVDAALRRTPLNEADRRLFTSLVYGVTERQVTLDFLLSRFSSRPPDTLEPVVRTALRIALYQLIYLDRIPDHAAVNESVSLVPHRSAGYVNAVLHAYLRFEAALPAPNGGHAPRENACLSVSDWCDRFPELRETPLLALSVASGIPLSLTVRLSDALGLDRAAALLPAFSVHPPVTLRVNPLQTTAATLKSTLTEAGFEVSDGLYAPHALRLASGAVASLPAFDDGAFMVQDEASQLCVSALGALPGQTVLDLCACPGSKSFGLAMNMQNQGQILSGDLHESKLSLIESGARRLGINIIRPFCRDARTPDPSLFGRCDRVLCDVPCSGLGVIAKKPEIRHKDLSASDRLPAIQSAILEAGASCVRVGGRIVYSTCTLLPAENEAVVTDFLARHPDFTAEDFSFPPLSPSLPPIVSADGMATLCPDTHHTDGFFIARMRKKG